MIPYTIIQTFWWESSDLMIHYHLGEAHIFRNQPDNVKLLFICATLWTITPFLTTIVHNKQTTRPHSHSALTNPPNAFSCSRDASVWTQSDQSEWSAQLVQQHIQRSRSLHSSSPFTSHRSTTTPKCCTPKCTSPPLWILPEERALFHLSVTKSHRSHPTW